MRVLYNGKFKHGGPIPDIIKMVHYNHPEVEFIPYSHNEKGDVILSINKAFPEAMRGIRKVIYLGSVPTFEKFYNGWSENDHYVFISKYCKNIFLTRWKFKKYSVVLTVGSLPIDSNMNPLNGPREIDGPIQFVAIAKWFKRPYKRLKQILRFYNYYLKKEYPDSILNIVGTSKERLDGNIHFHKKSFNNPEIIDVFKKCHIQLIPTPFDTGPKTLAESLHYRIPFVCSNNCAGAEYVKKIGKCGIIVKTDEDIYAYKQYVKYQPLDSHSIYNRSKIPYDKYLEAVKNIVENYGEYTSWEWNNKINYERQSDKLYAILKG